MGFRTVMITADYHLDIPQWFVDKWQHDFHFGSYERDGVRFKNMPIASKFERKFYASKGEEIFTDLQQVLNEQDEDGLRDFEIVLFHECDGVTKTHIGRDFIRMYEPSEWHEVDGITHDYCYGCSTPESTPTSKEGKNSNTEGAV